MLSESAAISSDEPQNCRHMASTTMLIPPHLAHARKVFPANPPLPSSMASIAITVVARQEVLQYVRPSNSNHRLFQTDMHAMRSLVPARINLHSVRMESAKRPCASMGFDVPEPTLSSLPMMVVRQTCAALGSPVPSPRVASRTPRTHCSLITAEPATCDGVAAKCCR